MPLSFLLIMNSATVLIDSLVDVDLTLTMLSERYDYGGAHSHCFRAPISPKIRCWGCGEDGGSTGGGDFPEGWWQRRRRRWRGAWGGGNEMDFVSFLDLEKQGSITDKKMIKVFDFIG
ncbi:hypothetical protein RHMOL_Rhmol03G0116600 [Rhododendron molle]|uniref:Uncharacterized protein n=1 Tax=Rhododendron molle TaxID=49168 RepID=A0ACC0PDF6_RHOML|nr:hypothetical protein RHMOL_Rhmol03G0116600 [Rhododendron molle]